MKRRKQEKGIPFTLRDLEIFREAKRILDGEWGEEARQCLLQQVDGIKKHQQLKKRGIKSFLPRPRLGRPQLFVIKGEYRKTGR